MYKTFDKSAEYYCLDIYTNKYWKIGDKSKLIEYCATHIHNSFYQVSMNRNDLYRQETWYGKFGDYQYKTVDYFTRQFMFFDGLFRVIDIRDFKDEIANYKHPKRKLKWRWWRGYSNLPEFRKGPVPGTGKLRGYYCLRAMRTTQERRINADPEVYEYVRPARRSNNLPNAWDDIWRNYYKGWKDCTKKRKQWM